MSDIPLANYQVTGVNPIHVVDPKMPWQSLVARTATSATATTDMTPPLSGYVKVPPFARYIDVMGLAASSGIAMQANIFAYPPGALTSVSACNQGVKLASAVTLTTTARTANSVSSPTTSGQHQSQCEQYDLRGFALLTGELTVVSGTNCEVAVRFMG